MTSGWKGTSLGATRKGPSPSSGLPQPASWPPCSEQHGSTLLPARNLYKLRAKSNLSSFQLQVWSVPQGGESGWDTAPHQKAPVTVAHPVQAPCTSLPPPGVTARMNFRSSCRASPGRPRARRACARRTGLRLRPCAPCRRRRRDGGRSLSRLVVRTSLIFTF